MKRGKEKKCYEKIISNVELNNSVNEKPVFYNSPYYQTCTKALGYHKEVNITLYNACFEGVYNKKPLKYDTTNSLNPSFNLQENTQGKKIFLNPYLNTYHKCNSKFTDFKRVEESKAEERTEEKIVQPTKAEKQPKVKKEKTLKEKKSSSKRAGVLLIVLIFSLICLLTPVISSLELIPDLIDIGDDIFTITEAFEDFSLQGFVDDYIEIALLLEYTLLGLLLCLLVLLALLSKFKIRVALIALVNLFLVACYLFISYDNLLQEFFTVMSEMNYGLIAMIIAPIIIFVLDFISYKK